MARYEKLYKGPAEVGGTLHENVELWAVDTSTVAAVIVGGGYETVLVADAVLVFVDGRLTAANGDGETVVVCLREREQRGTWLDQTVTDASGTVVATSATVSWSDQGVTVTTVDGTTEYPGATTQVRYGVKSILPWSGDPSAGLTVASRTRRCGSCGGGR